MLLLWLRSSGAHSCYTGLDLQIMKLHCLGKLPNEEIETEVDLCCK